MASPTTDSQPQSPVTYAANCHCGAIRYTVTLPRPLDSSPSQIKDCNCSICTRNGYLNVLPPTNDVKFITGSLEEMGRYEFAEKNYGHCYCKTCGGSLFIDAREKHGVIAVNIRNFKDVNLDKLEFYKADAKSREPAYEL